MGNLTSLKVIGPKRAKILLHARFDRNLYGRDHKLTNFPHHTNV